MTLDELDALPESGGTEPVILTTADGRRVTTMQRRPVFALYHAHDDALLIHDRHGRAWSIVSHGGKQYKTRHQAFDRYS